LAMRPYEAAIENIDRRHVRSRIVSATTRASSASRGGIEFSAQKRLP
jgi:hypothetical protein